MTPSLVEWAELLPCGRDNRKSSAIATAESQEWPRARTALTVQPRESPAALVIATVELERQEQQPGALNVVASMTAAVGPCKSHGNEEGAGLEQSESSSNGYDGVSH